MNRTHKESKKVQSSQASRNVYQKVVIQATNQANPNPPSHVENSKTLGPKTGTGLGKYMHKTTHVHIRSLNASFTTQTFH